MTGAGMVYVFIVMKWFFAALVGVVTGALRRSMKVAVLTALALLELTPVAGVILSILSDKTLLQEPLRNIVEPSVILVASMAATAGVAAIFHRLGERLRSALAGQGASSAE